MESNFYKYMDQRNGEYEAALAEACLLFEQEMQPGTAKTIEDGLSGLKLALDVWGLEPTTGWVGDAASGTISLGQAIYKGLSGKPGMANHLVDAAISAVSIIPFGDVVKLIKLKYGTKYAMIAAKHAREIKTAASMARQRTISRRQVKCVGPACGSPQV